MELEPAGIIPPDDDPVLGRDPAVERVEAAIEAGRDEEAVRLAREALDKGEGNRLDLLYLMADALLALGLPRDAEMPLRQVLEVDPQCPATRCNLAVSLFRQWRFEEARVECDLALAKEKPSAEAHVIMGQLLERGGDYDQADACFLTAARLDPDRYNRPFRLTRAQFDREVRQAARRLPRQFRKHLERVPVIVHDVPAVELARSEGQDFDPDLLGLFDGVPLPETASDAIELRPNYIYLFQRNLERFARDRDELNEQISITLYHELGHYLGFEEEDMEDLGLQ